MRRLAGGTGGPGAGATTSIVGLLRGAEPELSVELRSRATARRLAGACERLALEIEGVALRSSAFAVAAAVDARRGGRAPLVPPGESSRSACAGS